VPALAVGAGLVAGGRRPAPAAPAPAAQPSGEARVSSSEMPALPAASEPAPAVEVSGALLPAIDAAALAQRPTTLQARDRRAWRLADVLGDSYTTPGMVIRAVTRDGGDYILRGDGRTGDDVLIVRRETGELYVGWLAEGADDLPLADAERPSERIEGVVRIAIEKAAEPPARPPARLVIVVDGAPVRTLDAQGFAAAATLRIKARREGEAAAIDLQRAFGGAAQLVGLETEAGHVDASPPAPGARAVVYLTRRARFKFAWVDASGAPIRSTKQREVTEIALRTGRARR
jgi:hypothetical protein